MNRKLIHGLIPIVVIGAAATLGAIVSAQSTRTSSSKKAEAAAKVAAPAPDVQLKEQSDRKPLSFYVSSVKGDLFAPELPPLPKPQPKPAPIISATPPAPVNPLADYSYTGTVELNGQRMALVENIKTKEGQYLKEGDSFMGGTVSRIDDRTVGVMVAKTEQTMAKRDDFQLTPLDKNAPFLNAAPQTPGQPGQPGAPTPDGATPGFPGGGRGGRMNWMQNMTPEQRQQMQQRMLNRQFDRGSGGGGRRGGGGGGGGGGMMNFFGGG